jgi:branched-chain amino acid transport system permease protein
MLYRENGQFKTSYAADSQILPIRQDRIAFAVLMALAFVVIPLLSSEYLLRAIFIPFLILSLAALGLNILVGYCGQISLGSGAFMAVGAYVAYNCQARIEGMPLILSLLAGGLGATVLGVAFGLPSLRIKGLYLAVATLAAQFFVDWACLRLKWVTNDSSSGSVSVANLNLFGVGVESPAARYLLCLSFVVVFALVAKNLVRGHIGRSWMAMRDMDVAAAVIGIRPMQAKLAPSPSAASSSAWQARCGASSTWARGSRRPSASTARSTCCSWSSSAAWARSRGPSSARPSSSCCPSCSTSCPTGPACRWTPRPPRILR